MQSLVIKRKSISHKSMCCDWNGMFDYFDDFYITALSICYCKVVYNNIFENLTSAWP